MKQNIFLFNSSLLANFLVSDMTMFQLNVQYVSFVLKPQSNGYHTKRSVIINKHIFILIVSHTLGTP